MKKQTLLEKFDKKFPNEESGYLNKANENVWLFNPAVDAKSIKSFLDQALSAERLRVLKVIDGMKTSNVATIDIDENGNRIENLRADSIEKGYEQCKKDLKQALCPKNK